MDVERWMLKMTITTVFSLGLQNASLPLRGPVVLRGGFVRLCDVGGYAVRRGYVM